MHSKAHQALVRLWFAIGVFIIATVSQGCAGRQLEFALRENRGLARQARERGALRCAPRELARAEANADFAGHELDEGDYFRARAHLDAATDNVQAALRLASGDTCVGKPKPKDRDGDGIDDGADKCQTVPEDKDGFEDDDGCPDLDNDKDGVADASDRCPAEAEDKDGFEDGDGCPELDNDKDGIADSADKCPTVAEDQDGFEDEDGCPDPDNDKDGVADKSDRCPLEVGPSDNNGCPKTYEHIVVTAEKIELKQKIFFDSSRATIMPVSFELLAEIGSVLNARKTMRLRVEGHTDIRGAQKRNRSLSQQRADAVRQYLMGLGIDGARLEARGYGSDQPIETNRTEAGREKNRRVEFVITER